MEQITIQVPSGATPNYDVYLCDDRFYSCTTISTNVAPASFPITYNLSGIFGGINSVIIKIIDSKGCEYFEPFYCPVSITPTPTITPTLTPTPTPGCHCLKFENTGTTTSSLSLKECYGTMFYAPITSGSTLYYCGSVPSGSTDVIVTIGDVCVDLSCPPL